MRKISIRPATYRDIQAILAIHNEVIREGNIALDDKQRTIPMQTKWFTDHPFPYGVWVGEEEGEIIGWIALSKFSSSYMHRFSSFMSIYLTRSSRGKGIGKQLTNFLLKEAKSRGFHKIILMVCDGNRPALGLYEATGFRRVGVYEDHRLVKGKWENTIIMEQIL